MSEILNPGLQWVMVSAAQAFVLTLVLSPVVLWWYRRRVAHWMCEGGGDREAAQPSAPFGPPPRWVRLPPLPGEAAKSLSFAGACALAPGQLRLVVGHAVSGGVCALLLAAAFLTLYPQYITTAVVATVLLVALVPTAGLVMVLQGTNSRQRVLGAVAVCALPWALPDDLQGLAGSLYPVFVAVPLALLLVFSLRFWRGVAPMVLLVALAASALAVAMALLASRGFGAETVWHWRLTGLLVGAWVGYRSLQALKRAFDAGRLSDLDLFTDAWWLALLMLQATVLAVMADQPAYLALVAAYPLVVGVRRTLWRRMPLAPASQDATARPLLLLRVFSEEGRMAALFDPLEQYWRHLGPIHMIAGWDLALRNIGPTDFVAFVAGRLRTQFIGNAQDLQARLESLPTQRDADGRFRVSHFWCHANTWQPTMRALAARSHAVLMDLRGFTGDRQGCCYELLHLARHAPELPVLLLVDSPQVYAELQRLLGGVESTSAAWMVADVGTETAVLPQQWLARLATSPAPTPKEMQA